MRTEAGLGYKRAGLRQTFWRSCVFVLWAAIWPLVTEAASLTATLDPPTVTVGESATLTLTFDGEPSSIPAPPAITNLQIESQGTSRSMTIVNNRVSSSISHSFSVTPLQPGEYTIPALQADVDGQRVTSQPLKLVARQGERLAFFKLALPRKEVFLGEVFPVELQVYIRQGILNAENILQNFDEFGGSALKAEGFTILRTAHARRRQAQVDGIGYQVATLVSALSALKTGPLTIASMDVKFTLQLPVNSGQPGFFQQYRNRQAALSAEPETVTVLDLPKDNVPPNFNGAVGTYTMSVSAGPTNVAVGDPVTVRVQVSGKGALDALALPEQPQWSNFKTFPPTSKMDLTDALGLEGTKTFEQVVIPQNSDLKELPPVSFSFFNPESKKYQQVSPPAIQLVVRPAGAAPFAPAMASGARISRDSAQLQDIVPIKQRMGTLAAVSAPLLQQGWFLALQSLPILALAGALTWRKRIEHLANNPRLRRRRHVAGIVSGGVGTLRRQAASRDSDGFFATLFRLLQEQLGERLDLPASSITEAIIEERLRPRGVPEPILTELHELFQACNLARYAPVKSSQELESFIPKADALLRQLQALEL